MKEIKNISTGHLATGSKNGIISTSPLGSCVAAIAYDKTLKNGGIAHIMLPGKSPTENKSEENKYAENAIENLLDELKKSGSKKANIEICLLGGYERRTAKLILHSGIVSITFGDKIEEELFNFIIVNTGGIGNEKR